MTKKNWIFLSITLAGILFGILAGVFFSLTHDLPQINDLKQFKPSAVTTVYSADKKVIAQFYIEKRFPVSLDKIPKHLIDALLTIEDRTFFSHSGIHFKAIARAIFHDIKAGKFKQGGSTLTQQLAKTLFLTSEKSIVRKIKEAILSLQIERRYTKNEILELYLNQIYLGSGSYGVEAASKTYFNKSVHNITLSQAALLAGLPKAPSAYSPLKNPELAKKRRDIVLGQMLATEIITQEEYNTAVASRLSSTVEEKDTALPNYFVEYIRALIEKDFNLKKIYSNGLHIHTSMNMDFHSVAKTALLKQTAKIEKRMQKRKLDTSGLQAALIAIDIKTGEILCMIGGRSFNESPFNRAVQAKRQPGSSFKPFVYAAALDLGYSQKDILFDAPLSYKIPGYKTWKVENFSKTYTGKLTLRKALALSKNTPAVRLLEKLGSEKVVLFAQKAGISAKLNPNLSLALGTSEISLLELTAAYIPFANQGIKIKPRAIIKITDSTSRVIFENAIEKQSIMSRQNAAVITDMLKAVIMEGTGKKARVIKKEIAGKTGTTDQYKDALFIGFSPHVALGVWVGNDDSSSLGPYETGAKAALPIWIETMEYFLSKLPTQYFDIPDKTKMVYINPSSGKTFRQKQAGTVKALIKNEDRK